MRKFIILALVGLLSSCIPARNNPLVTEASLTRTSSGAVFTPGKVTSLQVGIFLKRNVGSLEPFTVTFKKKVLEPDGKTFTTVTGECEPVGAGVGCDLGDVDSSVVLTSNSPLSSGNATFYEGDSAVPKVLLLSR